MLRQVKDFLNFRLRARDGEIGGIREFYFDDNRWVVRYLVADTGSWLVGKQILISPYALKPAIEVDAVLPVDLTKMQIEQCPSLEAHEPVSRQFEESYYRYYLWPYYANGANLWGLSPRIERGHDESLKEIRREEAWDPNLRSTLAVSGYHIHALDGEIGHVEDFIIDEETWSIRYLVVDTKNWWAGRHVLVTPLWIERVSWEESMVFVNLTREAIQTAPEYARETFDREYETELYKHYNRRPYWVEEAAMAGKDSASLH